MNDVDKFIRQQVDGIFALEGFQVTETIVQVRSAVSAGKITHENALEEFFSYVAKYKGSEGFLESRDWLQKKSIDEPEIDR